MRSIKRLLSLDCLLQYLEPALPTCVVLQELVLYHAETVTSAHHIGQRGHLVRLLRVYGFVFRHATLGAESGQRRDALVHWFGQVVLHVEACK